MLEKAVMLDPKDDTSFTHLCTVLRCLGHTEREAEMLREVCGKRLVNHVLLGYSATCMLEMGNVREAGGIGRSRRNSACRTTTRGPCFIIRAS